MRCHRAIEQLRRLSTIADAGPLMVLSGELQPVRFASKLAPTNELEGRPPVSTEPVKGPASYFPSIEKKVRPPHQRMAAACPRSASRKAHGPRVNVEGRARDGTWPRQRHRCPRAVRGKRVGNLTASREWLLSTPSGSCLTPDEWQLWRSAGGGLRACLSPSSVRPHLPRVQTQIPPGGAEWRADVDGPTSDAS